MSNQVYCIDLGMDLPVSDMTPVPKDAHKKRERTEFVMADFQKKHMYALLKKYVIANRKLENDAIEAANKHEKHVDRFRVSHLATIEQKNVLIAQNAKLQENVNTLTASNAKLTAALLQSMR